MRTDWKTFAKAQVFHYLTNPKTTFAGVAGVLTALGVCLQYQFDDDPNTVPDWIQFAMGCLGCLMLLNATDTVKGENDPVTVYKEVKAETGVPPLSLLRKRR